VRTWGIAAAAASIPQMAQAQVGTVGKAKQPVWCEVKLQSDDGGGIMVFTGITDQSQITWILPQADPLFVRVTYLDGPSIAPEKMAEGSVELRLVAKPTSPLTAVFRSGQRSWRFGMTAYDRASYGAPDVRVTAALDPGTSEGSEVGAAISSSEPLSVSVEYDGGVVFSAQLAPDRVETRNRLIAQARAKVVAEDPGSCNRGPPPLLVPPPPPRQLQ
jgi:hypothetical protein